MRGCCRLGQITSFGSEIRAVFTNAPISLCRKAAIPRLLMNSATFGTKRKELRAPVQVMRGGGSGRHRYQIATRTTATMAIAPRVSHNLRLPCTLVVTGETGPMGCSIGSTASMKRYPRRGSVSTRAQRFLYRPSVAGSRVDLSAMSCRRNRPGRWRGD